MRILVANTPKMYREAIAVSLRLNRPDAEVLLDPSGAFDGRVERFGPHLVVLDRGDGVLLDGLPVALPRLELRLGATMDGRIVANGGVKEIEDVDTQDLLALVDEVEKTILEEAAREPIPARRSSIPRKLPPRIRHPGADVRGGVHL